MVAYIKTEWREFLDYWVFVAGMCARIRRADLVSSQLVQQVYAVGVRSLPTTVTAGLFVGAIMAIQIRVQLADYGAEVFLGGLSSSVTLRHVGPVLIAFLLSGKVGAYTSAELATMQVTDQVDALRCLGVDPIRFLVVPRFIAVTVSSFLLLLVGLMLTIAGGVLVLTVRYHVSPALFFSQVPRIVTVHSLEMGTLKSLLFGALLGTISCFQGYIAKGGAAGVGECVRKTAVLNLVWIVLLDYGLSVVENLWGIS